MADIKKGQRYERYNSNTKEKQIIEVIDEHNAGDDHYQGKVLQILAKGGYYTQDQFFKFKFVSWGTTIYTLLEGQEAA